MSTDLTSEGGHGAVPTGPQVPVEPKRAAARRDWPLYELFLRGKRGLNHVHVGSLQAPDDEMAVHEARDLYTRRNEGVSIWVVRAERMTASSPDEKDPMFRAERRQGLPAPDVLRHPGRRPPHLKAPSPPPPRARGRASERWPTTGTGRSVPWATRRPCTRPSPPRTATRGTGSSAPGFDEPLAGVDTSVPG